MKTIYKGKDDLYYLVNIKTDDGTILTPSDIDALTIEFFTPGTDEPVVFDKDDISAEGILHVDAERLENLRDGALKARFHISLSDENFADSTYDQVAERLTGYFLKTIKN